jgi:putative tryptophan/tyrosine transport system substrate-binding protein
MLVSSLGGGTMRRRDFIAIVGGATVALPRPSHGQKSGRVVRMGVLSPFFPSIGPSPSFDAFSQTMRELGWIEGQNIAVEYRWAEGRADRLQALAAELAHLKLDIIFSAWGTPTALAARDASATTPIVFAGVGDAVGAGLVKSLTQPGANITGSTFITEETIAKQFDLLRETVPTLSRVGVLINPTNPVYDTILKATQAPAQAIHVKVQVLGVQSTADFEDVLAGARKDRVDGVIVLRDQVFIINKSVLVGLAAKYQLPALYGMSDFALAGGLMSYGPNMRDMFRRAAYVVDKILGGARPSDVPVEQATRFELVINLKTAKATGLEFPPTILARADEVIE